MAFAKSGLIFHNYSLESVESRKALVLCSWADKTSNILRSVLAICWDAVCPTHFSEVFGANIYQGTASDVPSPGSLVS